MITPKQRKLNDFIIKEAGLELDSDNHVLDQDTGLPIKIRGKSVKYNNTSISRLTSNEIEFDPLNNPLLASEICGNYINKLGMEDELDTIAYGITNTEKNTAGKGVWRGTDGNIIYTDSYNLDSLKYIGLVAKLNNTEVNSKEVINLKSYDQKEKCVKRKK